MMRGLSWSLFGAAVLALGLSGCANQYFERKDTVTFNAGDAVAWNNAQQIVDPTPRRAYDTNIVTPGETAARAGADYAQGRNKWFTEPAGVDEPRDIMNSVGASSPDRGGMAGAGGGGPGAGGPGGAPGGP